LNCDLKLSWGMSVMTFELSTIHTKARICEKNGFTLIEVLIALVILSVGILGVAKMQLSAIKGNTIARKHTQLIIAAQNQIELIMQMPYSTLSDGATSLGHSDDSTIPENYTLTYNVSTMSDCKKITVSLSHLTEPNGNPSASLTFIRAEDL